MGVKNCEVLCVCVCVRHTVAACHSHLALQVFQLPNESNNNAILSNTFL